MVAGQSHLSLLTLGKAKFINPQGLDAVKLIANDDPKREADDDELTVYGVNNGENSIIYNKSMTSIGLYGYDETGIEALNDPWDLAATPGGLVFISDSGNRRIVKLRNIKGKLKYSGSFGQNENKLVLPRGIDVTDKGWVIIADAGNGSVARYDTLGNFIDAVDGFDRPVGLAAVDRSEKNSLPRDEYFIVVDSGGTRINKMKFDGSVINRIDVSEATGISNVYIGHVDIEHYHCIIATDSINHCIHKFDPKLNYLGRWGREGDGRASFRSPTGIAIWRHFGQTFISDSHGAQYLWLGTDIVEEPVLETFKDGSGLILEINLTSDSKIEMLIKDENKKVLKNCKRICKSGSNKIRWNWHKFRRIDEKFNLLNRSKSRDSNLPPGKYSLVLKIRARYSSTEKFEKVLETEFEVISGDK